MKFSPSGIFQKLPNDANTFWVGYSGGMDSHVLLHALHALKQQGLLVNDIRAVHVNHGLSDHAGAWQVHCQAVCRNLGIDLVCRPVTLAPERGNVEAQAREARLAVFAELLEAGDVLLSAHHLDDQVETMLFRLMRGTGLKGLAGIPGQRDLGQGRLCRPLLQFTRDELAAYARHNQLAWVDDDSNGELGYDRNFLRHRVLPLLAERWPGFRGNWQRLAGLAGESEQLLQALGERDLAGLMTTPGQPNRIELAPLRALSPDRQRNVLRAWLQGLADDHGVPVPDYAVTESILHDIMPASVDAEPCIGWGTGSARIEARRFADALYVIKAGGDIPAAPYAWPRDTALVLPAGLGELRLARGVGTGIDLSGIVALEVRFRQGGESAKPAGRRTRPLKKIFQDYRVPPWLRDRVPLVYHGDDLVAVADLFICQHWQRETGDSKRDDLYAIQWDRSFLHCGY